MNLIHLLSESCFELSSGVAAVMAGMSIYGRRRLLILTLTNIVPTGQFHRPSKSPQGATSGICLRLADLILSQTKALHIDAKNPGVGDELERVLDECFAGKVVDTMQCYATFRLAVSVELPRELPRSIFGLGKGCNLHFGQYQHEGL